MHETHRKAWWQSSAFKFFLVAFLILIMCIPLAFVGALVGERKNRYETVQQDISQHWGQAQGVLGPVLFIPFSNDPKKAQEYAVLLPEKLSVSGKVDPEIRHRGIFQSVVYTSKLQLEATFSPRDQLSDAEGLMKNPKWAAATIGASLNDPKGLLSGTTLEINGKPSADLQPAATFSGIQAPVNALPLNEGKALKLSMTIHLNGSRILGFAPAGKESHIQLAGPHGKPSFNGEYLPTERQLTEDSFKASWDISHLSRRFPQLWRQPAVSLPTLDVNRLNASAGVENNGSDYLYSPYSRSEPYPSNANNDISSRLSQSAFGVTLMEPVDAYKQTERSLKYGILFLALTFITYFLFERLTRANIHLLQYVMVGLALSLFYLIVLSVSELWGFGIAYALGAAATITLISYYSAGFIPRKQQYVMPAVLTGLYVYLYSLLQLEDFSLLFGTVGLFVALAVLMMVTRSIHNEPE